VGRVVGQAAPHPDTVRAVLPELGAQKSTDGELADARKSRRGRPGHARIPAHGALASGDRRRRGRGLPARHTRGRVMTHETDENARYFVPAKPGEVRIEADCHGCQSGWNVPERVWEWFSFCHARGHRKDQERGWYDVDVRRYEPGKAGPGKEAGG